MIDVTTSKTAKVLIISDPPHERRIAAELSRLGHDVTYIQDIHGHAMMAIRPGVEWVIALKVHTEPGRLREKARQVGARYIHSPLGWSKCRDILKGVGFPLQQLPAEDPIGEAPAEPVQPALALVPTVQVPLVGAVPVKAPRAVESIHIGEDVIHGVRGADGQPWVVLRRACEALGVDPSSQRQKVQAQPWAVAAMVTATGPDGKNYESFCLHADSVPMWLATIEATRCAPGSQERIIRWQREAARALADWAYGRPAPAAEPEDMLIRRGYEALMRRTQALEARNEALESENAQQAHAIEAAAPKVVAYDRFLDTTNTCCITEGAKAIGRKPLKFHRWLEEGGHIYRRGRSVLARQDHLDAGRMVQRSVTIETDGQGTTERITQTRLTAKGLSYFDERCPREAA